jgi:hypothetical protein
MSSAGVMRRPDVKILVPRSRISVASPQFRLQPLLDHGPQIIFVR